MEQLTELVQFYFMLGLEHNEILISQQCSVYCHQYTDSTNNFQFTAFLQTQKVVTPFRGCFITR